jgi:2-polyprenyl-6-methoxyphenol hydroxylase-like FAD-dependent oxidoreductase
VAVSRKHALVIGGSVGGLFAARMLQDAGWSATVYERTADDLAGRGAGIGITQELLDAMRRVGAPVDPTIGIAIKSFCWLAADGTIRLDLPRPLASTVWARVYKPLRAAFPDAHYRVGAGANLVAVEQGADSVTAIFEDGSRATGDLLVAADGNSSTVRRQLLPEVAPRYAGYVAWRGVVEERDAPPETVGVVFDRIAFSFAEGEMMLTMLVPGEGDDVRPGHRRYYFIWYRPTGSEAELRDLFTDATRRDHGASIPPPLIRPELLAAVKGRAGDIFAPAVAAVVRRAPLPLLQAITDMESPRLAFGRVAVMGDAAFVARPHVAAGITKAALDASALVAALAVHGDDIPAALGEYERAQLDFGTKLVAHARLLGSYVGHSGKPGELGPTEVMAQYGAPRLLHDPDPATFRVPDAMARS